jgi:hypothetical protein
MGERRGGACALLRCVQRGHPVGDCDKPITVLLDTGEVQLDRIVISLLRDDPVGEFVRQNTLQRDASLLPGKRLPHTERQKHRDESNHTAGDQ